MDMAAISQGQPPRSSEHTLAFGLSLESTPLRLATPLRSLCALCRAPRRPAHQIRQLFRRRRETRLKGKIAMNSTAIFPIFETLVKPFKFAASPYEYKVTALRECPTPDTLQHCETPDKAADYWRLHIATHPHFNPDCECLAVLLLNTRSKVKGHQIVSIGLIDTILVHPREVFRLAIVTAASAVIVMHNHPSGESTPSEADIKVTRDLIRAGQLLKMELLDHVIIGNGNFSSLRALGYFYS